MLALALGMSVRRAQQEIDSREFADWLAFSKIHPFGIEADDLRSAILSWLVFSVNTSGERRRVVDFMLSPQESRVMSADEIAAAFRVMASRGV